MSSTTTPEEEGCAAEEGDEGETSDGTADDGADGGCGLAVSVVLGLGGWDARGCRAGGGVVIGGPGHAFRKDVIESSVVESAIGSRQCRAALCTMNGHVLRLET